MKHLGSREATSIEADIICLRRIRESITPLGPDESLLFSITVVYKATRSALSKRRRNKISDVSLSTQKKRNATWTKVPFRKIMLRKQACFDHSYPKRH